jgi:ribosomal-protein-alanine acetyltransferase
MRAVESIATPRSRELRISPMHADDLDRVTAIAERSFHEPWTRGVFEREIASPSARAWTASGPDGLPIGFVVFSICRDEAHVSNVAVDPDARRRGHAREMLIAVLRHAARSGVHYATLEVHERNTAAVALYASLGFERVGERPNYYARHESAIVMFRAIEPDDGGHRPPLCR